MAAPGSFKAFGLGCPSRFSGLTSVVSTASCAPWWMLKPLTTHSKRRLSVGSTGSRFRSRRKPLNSRPPASLQTLRHIRSSGTALVCKTPAFPHAAQWSPKGSSGSPQRQFLGATCRGSPSRCSRRVLSCAGCYTVSSCTHVRPGQDTYVSWPGRTCVLARTHVFPGQDT